MFPFLYYILVVSISSMIVPELSPHGHIYVQTFCVTIWLLPTEIICISIALTACSFFVSGTAKVMLFFDSPNFFKKKFFFFSAC